MWATECFSPFFNDRESSIKIKTEKVDVILITPSWLAQPWYSQVLELCVTEPQLLPQMRNMSNHPKSQAYPLFVNQAMRLMAWKVSGRAWPRKEFQQGLQSLSQVAKDQAHLITNRLSINSLAGVMNGKLIHIHAI